MASSVIGARASMVLVWSWLTACASPSAPPAQSPPSTIEPTSAAAGSTTPARPAIERKPWGQSDGQQVDLFTLTNQSGLVLKVTNYGATVTELHVPDRNGKLADVVLGFDELAGYQKGGPYFGAIVGRVANRIRGAKFTLDGKQYALAANNGPNHLHGGVRGFDKVVWSAEPKETAAGPALALTYVSKDGEEGYPGTLSAQVTYTLTERNELKVEMRATTSATTIVNLAHHGYWNLAGHASGSILGHELQLYADQYTPGDPQVPTGAVAPVAGTPFDFSKPKAIGRDLAATTGAPKGYDNNFVVEGEAHALRPVARLHDPRSGRVMTLESDQPGVQLYSGNFLDGKLTGKGVSYVQYAGVCLETQRFPAAINVPVWADQVILKPGQTYQHDMIHRFTVE
ncbi:MAG: aldose epimerase family protein [Polyangiaceae bacterium]